MKKILFFAIIMTCCNAIAFAQKGLLTGKVTDMQNLSLPGAVLRLEPGNLHTISDTYGKFQFLNVPVGQYTLTVSYIGYNSYSSPITVIKNKAVSTDVIMNEATIIGKEVVIMGDRLRGQAKALNVQKSKLNISNIVSADQVGRFPDANIGDALKRIPGVTMQNDQGEARNIIIRGLAPELSSVTLNGDRIPSAEGDNRRVQMDLIPSDMIQTIEVNKTLTPDMDADAIGGSVNLITRATPNGQRISATFSGGYAPIREKPLYNAGLVYGNRFLENRLGIVVSGSYNHHNYGSDNVEAVWKKDDFGNTFIGEQDIRKYDVLRVRSSIATALDFKFSDKHQITLNAMYNWRDDKENRYRFTYKDVEPIYDANDNITGYEGVLNRETKGGINSNRVDNARLEDQRVQNYSINGDHLLGPKLDMHWGLSYSTAREYRPNERYIEFETESFNLNKDFGTPRSPFLTSTTQPELSDYELDKITENTDETKENELATRLDFRTPLSLVQGQKGRLRFGGRLRLKNKNRNNSFIEYAPIDGLESLSDASIRFWGGDKGQAGTQYVPGNFASREFLGGLQLNNSDLFEAESDPSEFLAANYNAKETILAAYLRWDQDFSSQLSMIAGARLEKTWIKYSGNLVQDEEELEGVITTKNNYVNILPSLTFKYTPTENLVIRAAATTALARPNYYVLSPFVNTIIDDERIDAGNPDLKASFSWNYDLMGEYYFKSLGILSGGLFYKNIDDFIYQYRDENMNTGKFTQQFPGMTNPVPAGENWTLVQARNGESVKVYGLEVALQRQLDFLPGKFLKGFGIYTNYTFTKSKTSGIYNEDGELRSGIPLPGTTPHMFNASLSWENKKFSARLSLNYAADYIDELGGNDFEDRFYDKQVFLDANASYVIGKYWRIFGEANNLTNQPLRYYQGISSQTMQMEYYRSKFNLGLKFDLNR
ncbi:TonB-dependent receptor [Pedobacter frigoris]|uniref:TonB-dependent receptor n=1 Tax=Pedobacter frigoris TaxID=2571272 RepID=A0A4U1CRB2_9SPHI|nr:TonB-dependent receptor [Pedobacter frigoris]TKC09460.1 TonB-dependent receptor [Pedobacter frigoris]